ncbi:divergent polysaccharide deacetylase family protein [Phyllobacterium chamaecytisi]|uniref:divergent polysaccharide deacetylase family protein n=1 Tax=Phyllobacterium chamaecytisi TaxID=2876082 RepID=UPI001CCC1C2F|nr:divergent polysaccharide deacetylase family protein [Phyllobacterium sp. KW56]
MNSDLNRPLGQNSKRPDSKTDKTSLIRWLLPSAAIVCVLGLASFVTYTSHQGFRRPVPEPPKPQVAEAAPTVIPPPAPAHDNKSQPGNIVTAPEGGPKVIVVGDPTRRAQDPRTAHIPEPDMLEQSPQGPLPIIAPDGRRPLDIYARPWSGARGARVAIIIGGLGLSQTGSQQAIQTLPPEVTLAFSPEGNSLLRWMQAARQDGHEVLMQIPLEPYDYPRVNPGRNTLTVDASPAATLENLHRTMGRITNYTGVMNYMGARFTAEPEAMTTVVQDIAKRGLLYLDDGTSARSKADSIAAQQGAPFAAADLLIDASQDRGAILKKLDELERIARAKGTAIATGSAFDVTVEAVTSWANEAKARGIEIVPVSALVRDPEKG